MVLENKTQHRPMSSMRIDPDLRRKVRSRKNKLNTMRSEWIQGDYKISAIEPSTLEWTDCEHDEIGWEARTIV
jgi:hypothetical protein